MVYEFPYEYTYVGVSVAPINAQTNLNIAIVRHFKKKRFLKNFHRTSVHSMQCCLTGVFSSMLLRTLRNGNKRNRGYGHVVLYKPITSIEEF